MFTAFVAVPVRSVTARELLDNAPPTTFCGKPRLGTLAGNPQVLRLCADMDRFSHRCFGSQILRNGTIFTKEISLLLACQPPENSRAMSAMSMSVGRGGTKKRAFVPHGVVAPASFPRTGRFAEQMISDDERSQLEELARSLDFGDDHGAGQPQQSNTVRAAAGCISSQTWGYTMRTIVDPSPEHINQSTHPFFSTHTNTHETRLVASFRSAYRRPPAGLSGTMNRRPLGGRISRVSRRNSSTFSRCGPRPNRWLRSLARL